jgi:hypothetical protein
MLEQRRYAKRAPVHAGGAILAVELAARGCSAVADTVVPGAEDARQRIIASLVNTRPEASSSSMTSPTSPALGPCSSCTSSANSRHEGT